MKQINITLQDKTLNEVKIIADMEGLPYTVMLRNWIIRQAREYVKPSAICNKEVSA